MNKILLDTSGYSLLMSGDASVRESLSRADMVYMSAIVLGELYYGFRRGSKERENIERLERFMSIPGVALLEVADSTAQIFGDIKYDLARVGTPLPINDVWVASHAIESGAVVVTADERFRIVPGLRLWRRPGE